MIRFLLMFRHTLRLTLLIEPPCGCVNQPSHDVIRSQLHLHRSTHLPGDRIDSQGDASTRMLSARAPVVDAQQRLSGASFTANRIPRHSIENHLWQNDMALCRKLCLCASNLCADNTRYIEFIEFIFGSALERMGFM